MIRQRLGPAYVLLFVGWAALTVVALILPLQWAVIMLGLLATFAAGLSFDARRQRQRILQSCRQGAKEARSSQRLIKAQLATISALDKNLVHRIDILQAEFERLGREVAVGQNTRTSRASRPELMSGDAETHKPSSTISPSTPSFLAKFASLKRLDQMGTRQTKNPVWRINNKLAAYDFAARLGVATPLVFGRWNSISEVDWASLPETFMLKSITGASSRAVFPLQRRGENYVDMFTNIEYSTGDLVRIFDDLAASRKAASAVFAEELLGHAAWPLDIKFYCFYGEIGLVLARDCQGKRPTELARVMYTDARGTSIPDAMEDDRITDKLRLPDSFADLASVAKRISAAIPRPFVRIDMFDRDGIPVLGEITPLPGGEQRLRADLDVELGRLWESAEFRLQSHLLEIGGLRLSYSE